MMTLTLAISTLWRPYYLKAKNMYVRKLYETLGSCRICDFVVYNSRAPQDTSEPACRCQPNCAPWAHVPPRHIAVFTSTSGTQPDASAVPAERAWEALAGARWRFWRPLQLAIFFSTAIADGAEWHQTDHPKRSQSVSRPGDPGAQFGGTGRKPR